MEEAVYSSIGVHGENEKGAGKTELKSQRMCEVCQRNGEVADKLKIALVEIDKAISAMDKRILEYSIKIACLENNLYGPAED